MNYQIYDSALGKLLLAEENGFITNIFFENSIKENECIKKWKLKETEVIAECRREIESYLQGELINFSVPINPELTPFQKRVLDEVSKIEYGKTASYKEIAEKAGNKNGARAVGNANNRNPIPIIIPCHRVIGKNGNLTGYGGGLQIKEYLLKLESNNSNN